MALVFNDRVKETSVTTGTGTLDLGGAVQDFETFVAGIGNTNETYYTIVNPGTGEFEVGRGTVTDASTDTLSRAEVFSSSNSDNPVNFTSGTKDVFCTLPASKAVVEDASNHVTLPADLTVGANLDVSSGTIKLDGNYPVGTNNVALGNGALEDNVSGGANTSIGNQAGRDVTSSNNTAIGGRALYNAVSGDENTCVGSSTLFHTTGSNNTSIGFTAGSNLTSGNNCTFIGNQAQPSSATVSNEITLGNSSVTSLRIPGLQSGASSGDVLTFDGTDIGLATPTTGATEAFAIKMALTL